MAAIGSGRFFLLFPPGWTLHAGGPHLSLPLIRAALEKEGAEVRVRDLNIEIASSLAARIPLDVLIAACRSGTAEAYNDAYFVSQRALDEAARPYRAMWDVRLGFQYAGLSPFSSSDALIAARLDSPFIEFYRHCVIPEIDDFDPDVVGFSLACIQQMVPLLQLCRLLREAGSRAKIVVGGNTVTRLSDALVVPELFEFVDAFAFFQGENTVAGLADAIRRGRGLTEVPNLIWRDGTGIRQNRIDNNVNPSAVPSPNFDGLPLREYWGEPYLPAIAARGCYHGRCRFCAIPMGWGRRRFAGVRDPELVWKDILHCVERYGIRNFKFVDDAMPPYVIRFLSNRITQEGIDIKWEAYTRMESAWTDTDLPEIAGRSGFVKGYFGVEILGGVNRRILNKQDGADALLVLEKCRQAGILFHMFSMLGYPGTTPDDSHRTVEFALEHAELIDTLDIFAYAYARGTEVPSGAVIRKDPRLDWALELPFDGIEAGVLDSREVEMMTEFYEEIVFSRCPRLLHPAYRLVSPWRWTELVQPPRAQLSASGMRAARPALSNASRK